MRMIDADRLLNALNSVISDYTSEGKYPDRFGIDDAINLVEDAPTLTPPNEWISVEQLREMDGEPVWVEDVKHWALIDIEKGGQWDGVPFAIWAENGTKFTYNVESRGLHCYRCPPEEEEDNND